VGSSEEDVGSSLLDILVASAFYLEVQQWDLLKKRQCQSSINPLLASAFYLEVLEWDLVKRVVHLS
jgi:hypothetical protein